MISEDESIESSKEKTVLKDLKIRHKYEDLIRSGKVKEAKAYLASEVNFMNIHESNAKKGKRRPYYNVRIGLKLSFLNVINLPVK